ncbi:hypothetical protein M0Q50_04290 [bacterium]|jgi:hypothetical protein|nr:hypothetical protein [bacterium]
MIKFNNKIRVRCLECKEEHFIKMKHIVTDKEQRSIGFEYEHIHKGKLKCSCGEDMKLLTTIFEYPKGIINYVDTSEKSCLIMDNILEKDIIFVDDMLEKENNMKRYKSREKIYAEQYFNGKKFEDIEILIGKSSTTCRWDNTPDGPYIDCMYDHKLKLNDGDWICKSEVETYHTKKYKSGDNFLHLFTMTNDDFKKHYKQC